MTIYINDLSFEGGKGLIADWEKVKEFDSLLRALLSISSVTILAPKNIWDIPIGGFDVKRKQMTDGSKVGTVYGSFLGDIFKKFKPTIEDGYFFSMDKKMTKYSSSVGMAVIEGRPVVSITFDDCFKVEELKGWFKDQVEAKPTQESVLNLFEGVDKSRFVCLTDVSVCLLKNPINEPMWNREVSEQILKGQDLIHLSSAERLEKLRYFGALVAEANGWTFNKSISRLNKTDGHLRFIYDSHRNYTAYETAYLCIDLEGPDVCFELCDKSGNHLGQISWDNKRKPAKADHGIKVK